jgi:hypothetical protein
VLGAEGEAEDVVGVEEGDLQGCEDGGETEGHVAKADEGGDEKKMATRSRMFE